MDHTKENETWQETYIEYLNPLSTRLVRCNQCGFFLPTCAVINLEKCSIIKIVHDTMFGY
jgi:hypothetical protein